MSRLFSIKLSQTETSIPLTYVRVLFLSLPRTISNRFSGLSPIRNKESLLKKCYSETKGKMEKDQLQHLDKNIAEANSKGCVVRYITSKERIHQLNKKQLVALYMFKKPLFRTKRKVLRILRADH